MCSGVSLVSEFGVWVLDRGMEMDRYWMWYCGVGFGAKMGVGTYWG